MTVEITVPNQAAAAAGCQTECSNFSVPLGQTCSSAATSAPFSLAPLTGTVVPNVPLIDGGYGWPSPFCCLFPTCKTDLLKKYPVSPKPGTVNYTKFGIGGGDHKILPFPAVGSYIGGGGADSSIQVIVSCPGQGAVLYHFGAKNGNAGASIKMYAWFANCHAVVCGGDNSVASNCMMNDIISAMSEIGLKLDGIMDSSGCVLGGDDKWYFGLYGPSDNRNPGCKKWFD